MAPRASRATDASVSQFQWLASQMMALLEKNVAALEKNTSSSDALKEVVGAQVAQSIETNRMLDKHPAVLASIVEKLNDGGDRTKEAVTAVNEHSTHTVEGAVGKIAWLLAACTVLIVLGSLFDGAGTKYLQMLHWLTP